MAHVDTHTVITDLIIRSCSPEELSSSPSSSCAFESGQWRRIEKDLYLHTAQQSAWLQIAQATEPQLSEDDLVITDIRVGAPQTTGGSHDSWESRPGGIWVSRRNYTGDSCEVVTDIDVLFGEDAVDPRPQWSLIQTPLLLNASPEIPLARLSIRRGRAKPRPNYPRALLRVKEDGKFKVVQISDTHMVTGIGVCKDALDAEGHFLPESEADPPTVKFLEEVLDAEKPDLVLLTGDQLHHDIPDSQSALFKVVAPLIERSIPYAAVFGNHDSEGAYTLSRTAQMSMLQDLPFSLCQAGPEQVDGVGNYYLQVFAQEPSNDPLLTLYLLDSHEQIPSTVQDPDYDPIKQSQINWFKSTSQALRKGREEVANHGCFHFPLAFLHIPLPEFGDNNLIIRGGHRGEPTEGPSFNSHFYDALVEEGVVAVGCGHDHVNDFCALRPQKDTESQRDCSITTEHGPWLCYGGGSGFGGYCSYGKERYHRRTRVWEIDSRKGTIRTWKRVQYARDNVDELVLVEDGAVVLSADAQAPT